MRHKKGKYPGTKGGNSVKTKTGFITTNEADHYNGIKDLKKAHLEAKKLKQIRKLGNNWDRYEEFDDVAEIGNLETETESTRQSFGELVSKAGTSVSHFQFKDEREWNSQENDLQQLVLDLEKLGYGIHSSEISVAQRLFWSNNNDEESTTEDKQTLGHSHWYGDYISQLSSKTHDKKTSLNTPQAERLSDVFTWNFGDLDAVKNLRQIIETVKSYDRSPTLKNAKGITENLSGIKNTEEDDLDELDQLLALSIGNASGDKIERTHIVDKEDNNVVNDSMKTTKESSTASTEGVRLSKDVPHTFNDTTSAVKTKVEEPDLEDWLDEILG